MVYALQQMGIEILKNAGIINVSLFCRCGSEVEQFIRNERVVGSIPTTGSMTVNP